MAAKPKKPQPVYANHNYTIVITEAGSGVQCYGVENKKTGVIEARVGPLAHAMHLADEYDKDLRFGINREEEEPTGEKAVPMFTRFKAGGGGSGSALQ